MCALHAEEIVVATGNPHKVEEIREIFAQLGVRVVGLADASSLHVAEPVEDGATFAANARIKAVAYARALGRMVIADDSGLAVDALGGEPGVMSARWAGVGATREERDQANNRKLLAQLEAIPLERRTARFVCAMCVAAGDGSIIAESAGEFQGAIGFEPRGENGFGYDPLFVVDASGRTSAELTPAQKNERSHRGAATRAIARLLPGVVRSDRSLS